MRLLPERPNHAGFCSPDEDPQADRRRYRECDVWKRLSLWNLPTYPSRHSSGCKRRWPMSAVINVSNRRQFLKGVFSAGALVVASRVLPESAFAQDPAVRTRAQSAALSPSVYLGIDPDGTVFI